VVEFDLKTNVLRGVANSLIALLPRPPRSH
jgi:hypothetical protein